MSRFAKSEVGPMLGSSPSLDMMTSMLRKFFYMDTGGTVTFTEVAGTHGTRAWVLFRNGVPMLGIVVIKNGPRYAFYYTPDAWRGALAEAEAQ